MLKIHVGTPGPLRQTWDSDRGQCFVSFPVGHAVSCGRKGRFTLARQSMMRPHGSGACAR